MLCGHHMKHVVLYMCTVSVNSQKRKSAQLMLWIQITHSKVKVKICLWEGQDCTAGQTWIHLKGIKLVHLFVLINIVRVSIFIVGSSITQISSLSVVLHSLPEDMRGIFINSRFPGGSLALQQMWGLYFFFYKKLFYKKVSLLIAEKLRNP